MSSASGTCRTGLPSPTAARAAATGLPSRPPARRSSCSSASRDGTVRLWDVETGKAIGKPLAHPGPVSRVAFLQHGKTVASASGDRAWLWDARTQQRTHELSHPAAIRSLVAAHDGGALW